MVSGQLADMSTRGLPIHGLVSLQTGQLVNSWMLLPTVVVHCYISGHTLKIVERLLCIFCSCLVHFKLMMVMIMKKVNQQRVESFSVTGVIRELNSPRVD